MRLFLSIMLVGIFSPCMEAVAEDEGFLKTQTVWNNTSEQTDYSILAFIGQKRYVEEREKPEFIDIEKPDGTIVSRRVPAFDTRYEARYDVLDVIAGEHKSTSVDFVAYNHYSSPYFPKVNPVLLFLISHEGEWVHSKYLYYPVHETTDGDWAICGSPDRYKDDGHEGRNYVEPIGFVNPVMEKAGDKKCTMGTRVAQVFAFQNKMRFLPDKWRANCNIELGYRPNIIIGSGSHPTAKEQQDAQLYELCMERKAFEESK